MAKSALQSMFRAYATDHPADAARALGNVAPKEAASLTQGLPPRVMGPVLERMNPGAAAGILTPLGPDMRTSSGLRPFWGSPRS